MSCQCIFVRPSRDIYSHLCDVKTRQNSVSLLRLQYHRLARTPPVSKQIKELFCPHQTYTSDLSGKWEFGQTNNQSDNRPEGVNPASLITWKVKKKPFRPYIYLFLRVGDSYLPKVMKSAITRLFLTVSVWHHHGKRLLQRETFLWAGSQSLVQGEVSLWILLKEVKIVSDTGSFLSVRAAGQWWRGLGVNNVRLSLLESARQFTHPTRAERHKHAGKCQIMTLQLLRVWLPPTN